jgi:hypothetical protein
MRDLGSTIKEAKGGAQNQIAEDNYEEEFDQS